MKLHKSPNANAKLLALLTVGFIIIFVSKGKDLLLGVGLIALSAALLIANAKYEKFIDEKKADEKEKEYKQYGYVPQPIYSEKQERIITILFVLIFVIIISGVIGSLVLGFLLTAKYHVKNLKGYVGGVWCLAMAFCYIIALALRKALGKTMKKKEIVEGAFIILFGFLMFGWTLHNIIQLVANKVG